MDQFNLNKYIFTFCLLVIIPFLGEAQVCPFELQNDTTIPCEINNSFTLFGPDGYTKYQWNTGETTKDIIVNSAGTYVCKADLVVADVVTNGSFEDGNTGFTSTYIYKPPNEGIGAGNYSISTDPGVVNGWAVRMNDHTSGAGNMLTVDGTGVSIVWSQNIEVVPGINYDFSAWAASMGAGSSDINRAKLQFSINGELIGDIHQCSEPGVWENFSSVWLSGTATTALIEIVDQEPDGAGNDFVLDDITFGQNCSFTDSVVVDVLPMYATVIPPVVNCKGELITITSEDETCSTMKWFSDETSITPIDSGCTYSFIANKDSQYVYFEPDVSSTLQTVGASGFQNWGTEADNSAFFSVEAPMIIDGFSVRGDQFWSGCAKPTATVSIEKAGVVVAGPSEYLINCDGTVVTEITGLDFKIPAGTGYTLKIEGAGLKPTTGNPIVNKAGLISIQSSGPFYNWQVKNNVPNCPPARDSVLITAIAKETVVVSKNQGPFCLSDGPQVLVLDTTSNIGEWIGKGIVNNVSGAFDPAVAGVGTHVVRYKINSGCQAEDSVSIVVVDQKVADILTPDTSICFNSEKFKVRLSTNSTQGGVWESSQVGLVSNEGYFDPSKGVTGLAYKVYYLLKGLTAGCSAADSIVITINPIDLVDINSNPGPMCIADGIQTISVSMATQTGTWSGVGISNPDLGEFNPLLSGAGITTVKYTTNGSCPSIDSIEVDVRPVTIAEIETNDTIICEGTSEFDISLSEETSVSGVWLMGMTPASATFNPDVEGVHKVYYSVLGFNKMCSSVDSVVITVNPNADASISNPSVVEFCPADPAITLVANTPNVNGVWSSLPAGLVSENGVFIPSNAAPGKTTVYYKISQMCGDTGSIDLLVHEVKDPTITPFGPLCQSEEPVVMESVDKGDWTIDKKANNGIFDPENLSKGGHVVKLEINDFCPVSDSINVEVKEIPITKVIADTLWGCSPLEVVFKDASDSTALSSVLSLELNGTSVSSEAMLDSFPYTFNVAGCYDVILSNEYAYNCKSSANLSEQICVKPIPRANFTWDGKPTILNPDVHLINQSSDATQYDWTFTGAITATSEEENPFISFRTTVQDTFPITLIASNDWCSDQITRNIIIRELFNVYIPNAFTPNGDGLNEGFLPVGKNIISENYEFLIFNRWGERIFGSKTPGVAWNGTFQNSGNPVQTDVYVWKLTVQNTFTDEIDQYVGRVSLLR